MRNSWGDEWPQSQKGDGNAWVDVKAFMDSRDRGPGGSAVPSLDYMMPRDPKQPIKNQVTSVGDFQFEGETWRSAWVKGKYTDLKTGDVFSGIFVKSALTSGKIVLGSGDVEIGSFDAQGRESCGIMKHNGSIYCMHNGNGTQVQNQSACPCPK